MVVVVVQRRVKGGEREREKENTFTHSAQFLPSLYLPLSPSLSLCLQTYSLGSVSGSTTPPRPDWRWRNPKEAEAAMNDIKLALLGSPGAGKSGEDPTAAFRLLH